MDMDFSRRGKKEKKRGVSTPAVFHLVVSTRVATDREGSSISTAGGESTPVSTGVE